MKNFLTILFALGISIASAQKVYEYATPLQTDANTSVITFYEKQFVTPKINNPKGELGPYIAAKTMVSSLSEKDLEWASQDNILIANLSFTVANSTSLNVLLTDMQLSQKAKFYIISSSGYFGPYTSQNIIDNSFSHFPVQTNQIKLQFEIEPEFKSKLKFKIAEINAGFDTSFKDGTCNIASICPEADNYRKAQKSTVIISVNGSGFCTGTLINNTSRDFTPYIITAQHCLGGATNLSNWTFAFNYEAKSCDSKNLNNNQSISFRGADIVAQNSKSDFALLLLREEFGPNDSVHFAGWDKSTVSPEKQFVFHHPNGALKRFSLNDNPVTATTYLESGTPPLVWKVDKWEEGTTEGGSSGSSLMNENGNIIGTLVGGEASCNNINAPDYFGRMDVGFALNDDWTATLSPWLDPNQGNYDSIDGRDYPYSTLPETDLAIRQIYGVSSTSCDGIFNPRIVVKNVGKNPVDAYSLSINVNGSPVWIPQETIVALQPGDSKEYTFEERTFPGGETNFVIQLNTDGDAYLKNNTGYVRSNILDNAQSVTMNVITDDFGSENTWEIIDANNQIVASGGPYANDQDGILFPTDFCLELGCYTLKFYDSYGDGMCCEYGRGSFELLDANGSVLVEGYNGPTNSGGNPEVQESNFCLSTDGITNSRENLFQLIPNPSSSENWITVVGAKDIGSIRVFSLEGKLISTSKTNQFKAPKQKGIYVISINGYSAQRLVVE